MNPGAVGGGGGALAKDEVPVGAGAAVGAGATGGGGKDGGTYDCGR